VDNIANVIFLDRNARETGGKQQGAGNYQHRESN
jgi:hypothetical protein